MHSYSSDLHFLFDVIIHCFCVLANIVRIWSALVATETSVVPDKDMNSHCEVIIQPFVLVVDELVEACIGIADYHDRVVAL